ncbi:hypothetical protein AtDm6_1330 [Acetobacter tropicalis]|uniref:Uncharacterized protein n=1 Tax=Acetobacter tropicalis TaxID=104102 RepID=A0A094ZPK7_9PROT|nr:hypothetical protein AtDm6_1330 [Acetobacter tropicalis]
MIACDGNIFLMIREVKFQKTWAYEVQGLVRGSSKVGIAI